MVVVSKLHWVNYGFFRQQDRVWETTSLSNREKTEGMHKGNQSNVAISISSASANDYQSDIIMELQQSSPRKTCSASQETP